MCNELLALKQYSKAIQKAPTCDVLFTNRALCKIKLKKFDDACIDAREAISLSSISVKGHYLLGQALMHLCRYDDALKSLQTVSTSYPDRLGDLCTWTTHKDSHPVFDVHKASEKLSNLRHKN